VALLNQGDLYGMNGGQLLDCGIGKIDILKFAEVKDCLRCAGGNYFKVGITSAKMGRYRRK